MYIFTQGALTTWWYLFVCLAALFVLNEVSRRWKWVGFFCFVVLPAGLSVLWFTTLKAVTYTDWFHLAKVYSSTAGCIGFSQADTAVRDTLVLQRALQYAATFGYSVWLRPQDAHLGKGVAASGALATRLGLSGVPVAAETIALHTIFELMRATGARVHLCRLSSAAGVALVRAAKAEGLPLTADVSINSLHLSDVDIGYFNADMRLTPPLRQAKDRDALRAALADGTIDALVSDHNPVDDDAKTLPFGEAEPGATGLELLLSLALKWAADSRIGLGGALERVTCAPVRVLGDSLGSLAASAGRLVEGGVADLCLFDAQATWRLERDTLASQGKHSPFNFAHTGMALPGRVRATLVAGTVAYEARDA